jgi:hypothetical protein
VHAEHTKCDPTPNTPHSPRTTLPTHLKLDVGVQEDGYNGKQQLAPHDHKLPVGVLWGVVFIQLAVPTAKLHSQESAAQESAGSELPPTNYPTYPLIPEHHTLAYQQRHYSSPVQVHIP